MINFLLKTPFLNDILNKLIKKKTGCDLGLNVSKFDLRETNENIHVFIEADVNKDSTCKLISSLIDKGE